MCFQCDVKSGKRQPETVKVSASLDKLKQGATNDTDGFEKNLTKSVFQRDSLTKRARRKYFTKHLAYQLVNASRDDSHDSMERQYWQTVNCGRFVTFNGLETKSSYCGKRWCTVCNSIRTAQLISKYQPTIDEWEDKHFVTLTIQSVPGEELKTRINEMLVELRKIRDVTKKRFERGQIDVKPMSINKLECNFNPDKNTFNPHFHIITSSKEFADMLLLEWEKRHSKNLVDRKAQKVVKADSGTSKELFKYFSKMVVTVKKNGKDKSEVYADALNVIFRAIKGRRVLFHYGFKQNKDNAIDDELRLEKFADEVETVAETVAGESEVFDDSPMPSIGVYLWDKSDWLHVDTHEKLTGYVPSDKFKKFIETGIKFRTGRSPTIPTMPDWVRKSEQYKILNPDLKKGKTNSRPVRADADGDGDDAKMMFPPELYFEGDKYSKIINSIKK